MIFQRIEHFFQFTDGIFCLVLSLGFTRGSSVLKFQTGLVQFLLRLGILLDGRAEALLEQGEQQLGNLGITGQRQPRQDDDFTVDRMLVGAAGREARAAGAGVMTHLGLLATAWLPITVAILLSTAVTLLVTAFVMRAAARQR